MVRIYTTKEVLEKIGISRSTLYNWLNRGKVPDVSRDRNNYRIFTERDIKRLLKYKNLVKEPVGAKAGSNRGY